MAVAVTMDFEGGTLEQYDQVIEKMGLTPRGKGPTGALSHWVAETADGIRVQDLWESAAQYEAFANEQIGPFAAAAGVPNPPVVTMTEVHSYMTAH